MRGTKPSSVNKGLVMRRSIARVCRHIAFKGGPKNPQQLSWVDVLSGACSTVEDWKKTPWLPHETYGPSAADLAEKTHHVRSKPLSRARRGLDEALGNADNAIMDRH